MFPHEKLSILRLSIAEWHNNWAMFQLSEMCLANELGIFGLVQKKYTQFAYVHLLHNEYADE